MSPHLCLVAGNTACVIPYDTFYTIGSVMRNACCQAARQSDNYIASISTKFCSTIKYLSRVARAPGAKSVIYDCLVGAAWLIGGSSSTP